MSDEKQLTYKEVAVVADNLLAEGKRVTLEYLRRELGKGTHAQIAVFLSRWQQRQKQMNAKHSPIKKSAEGMHERQNGGAHHKRKSELKHTKRPERRFGSSSYRGDTRQNFRGFDSARGDASDALFSVPFSTERLMQEPESIRRLFWTLYLVKNYRIKVLEHQQDEQNASLASRMNDEREIRKIKKEGNEEVAKLLAELSRVKAASEREIRSLQRQLNLL